MIFMEGVEPTPHDLRGVELMFGLRARQVWEAEVGLIPKGYHIHHIDGDRGHNWIENLMCLPPRVHLKIPKKDTIWRPALMGGMERKCWACGEWKWEGQFHKSTRICKDCNCVYVRNYYRAVVAPRKLRNGSAKHGAVMRELLMKAQA